MERERAPKLMTVKEVRMAVGQDRLSKGMAYGLARVLGVRIGRRFLVPSGAVEALLEGRLPPEVLEAVHREARKLGGKA